jgi:branched-subunit amino acid transport protein
LPTLSSPNETQTEREERRPELVSDEINALGDILQAAATIAGISVALVAVLRTLPLAIEQELRLPLSVKGLVGFVAFLTLPACVCSLKELWNRVGRRDIVFRLSFFLLSVAIVVFALGFFFFAIPQASDMVSEFFGRPR